MRRFNMPRNPQTQAHLQAKIKRLEQENAQLRILFRVILDTAFLAVNGKETEEEKEEVDRE